ASPSRNRGPGGRPTLCRGSAAVHRRRMFLSHNPCPGTADRTMPRIARKPSRKDLLKSLRRPSDLVVRQGKTTRKIEATTRDPLRVGMGVAGEQAGLAQNRLFVHAPEEGSGANALLRQPTHGFLGIERDPVSQDYPV